jgi:hypothetical protein
MTQKSAVLRTRRDADGIRKPDYPIRSPVANPPALSWLPTKYIRAIKSEIGHVEKFGAMRNAYLLQEGRVFFQTGNCIVIFTTNFVRFCCHHQDGVQEYILPTVTWPKCRLVFLFWDTQIHKKKIFSIREGKRSFGTARRRLEDNIKTDF